MTGPIILVPKYGPTLGQGFSRLERAKAAEHPGRRTTIRGYQSPASWITDLLSLRKVLCLCSYCRVKFDHRKHHYRKGFIPGAPEGGSAANGKCDACKQIMEHCGGGTWFTHETIYPKTCIEPREAKRKARAMAGEKSVWRAINEGRN